MAPAPQILVLGGGRSDAWQPYPAIDAYLLRMTGVRRPRVCLLATASGDHPAMIEGFHATLDERAETSALALFDRTVADLSSVLLTQHAIAVGGGSSPNLLAIWRLHGVDRVLRDAWQAGVVLFGWSAGALCWFRGGTTNAFGDGAQPWCDGLGLLAGSFSPHDDSQPQRRPVYERAIAHGTLEPGWAVDDAVALRFRRDELAATLTCAPGGRAHRVERSGAGAIATPLDALAL